MGLLALTIGFWLIKIIIDASMLPLDEFQIIVKSTPLVSIDFVVRAPGGKVLLGYRNNRPAQGYWFVPGGRIFKDESIKLAFLRLLDIELGLRVEDLAAKPLGLYQHFYPDNFSGKSFSTHYVVIAYEIQLQETPSTLPEIQHSNYKWFTKDELLESDMVHHHTKSYFMRDKQAWTILA